MQKKIDTRNAIGFIGLGAMGIGVVKNLLNNNVAVSVFDINQEKKLNSPHLEQVLKKILQQ